MTQMQKMERMEQKQMKQKQMKQILIISGKGGTGKTTLTAEFARLAQKAVIADCDVDAANLSLLCAPSGTAQKEPFYSGFALDFNADQCIECGLCAKACRFDAISARQSEASVSSLSVAASAPGSSIIIDHLSCEGCGACVDVCPSAALGLRDKQVGHLYSADTAYGPMVWGELGIAEGTSGKLVAQVRQQAVRLAEEQQLSLIITDGPPGIGCPVIASLSGIDAAVVVTEPSVSGRHDLHRILELCSHFNVLPFVVINKWDLNPVISQEIESFCGENKIVVLGSIPFDPLFPKALANGELLSQFAPQSESLKVIEEVYQKLIQAIL